MDLQNRFNFSEHAKIDDSLPNRHTFICGKSGSGKTTVIKTQDVVNVNKRRVYWDPDRSYKAVNGIGYATGVREFYTELKNCMASGAAFDLALSMSNTRENFQGFCAAIVAVACASMPLTAYVEEVQQVTGNAEAEGYWSDLLTRSRKYGVQLVVISPRPQQCDKTTVTSCDHKYVCKLGRHPDREAIAKELGIAPTEIMQMGMKNVDKKSVHWYYLGPDGEAKLMKYEFATGETTVL